MLITEYRIPLPLTVEEYQIGQLFSTMEMSREETGGGEGVEVQKNAPFSDQAFLHNRYTSGQYTYKLFHVASRMPNFIRYFVDPKSLDIHEEAWNAFPYCKTVITNPGYMKDNFHLRIESLHMPGPAVLENALELPQETLAMRTVVYVDIANDVFSSTDYQPTEDPTRFQSKKTGRGPLVGDWQTTSKPLMTAYKLVVAEFKWFGLQKKVERMIQDTEQKLFLKFHRKVFCWLDKWYGLTLSAIRSYEEEMVNNLLVERTRGPIKGSTVAIARD